METSSSNSGLSASKSTRESAVLGALAPGVERFTTCPAVSRSSTKSNRGVIYCVAGSLVPSNPPSEYAPAEAEGKSGQKTALAQLFSKKQARAGENNRMLVTVNIIGSTGPLRFLVDVKDPVSKVIELALRAYAREGRLPHLGANCRWFELFRANSDLEVQSAGSLGARQFVMHRKRFDDQEVIEEQNEEVASLPWKFWWNLMNTIVCSQ
ncbi:hypothetical protein O6H91_04G144300 [Diphasiastrum complanatum]|uniref:Uncharacterized protein n=1 Tax=Diphasiastrum complanatum TaxID=34168 RepID=A0ACC2E302_DIPCM|nr:hypothetical protein O6H91_04G144300 [Diphasiastrum complanatum]